MGRSQPQFPRLPRAPEVLCTVTHSVGRRLWKAGCSGDTLVATLLQLLDYVKQTSLRHFLSR